MSAPSEPRAGGPEELVVALTKAGRTKIRYPAELVRRRPVRRPRPWTGWNAWRGPRGWPLCWPDPIGPPPGPMYGSRLGAAWWLPVRHPAQGRGREAATSSTSYPAGSSR